jgi:hypothetical protein
MHGLQVGSSRRPQQHTRFCFSTSGPTSIIGKEVKLAVVANDAGTALQLAICRSCNSNDEHLLTTHACMLRASMVSSLIGQKRKLNNLLC